MRKLVTFGQVSNGRENNFDFLRFFFASMVIVAHSYALLYNGTLDGYDPLVRFTYGQIGMGGLAVDGFFLISGFLITRSWMNSKAPGEYVRKRGLRILPALIVVILFSMFVVGPLATRLPISAYFHNSATYRYFGFMLNSSLGAVDRLPGVFLHNPLPERVNGPLWTIRQELVCYAVVAFLGLLGMYRRTLLVLALAAAAFYLDVRGGHGLLGSGGIHDFFHLVTYFFVGMLIYLYRYILPYTGKLVLAAVGIIIAATLIGRLPLVLPVCGAYVLFYVAFSNRIKLHKFANNGDFSYGMYLYAFPLQQLLVSRFQPLFNAYTLSVASLCVSMVAAVGSWHLVERPFLRRKVRSARPPGVVPGGAPSRPSVVSLEANS